MVLLKVAAVQVDFLQVEMRVGDFLQVEMCVESPVKGVMRLVLNGWCGYGEFLFNLQPCGYLWRGMESQRMVRWCCVLLQDAADCVLFWPMSPPL